jgi:hypothetical protein
MWSAVLVASLPAQTPSLKIASPGLQAVNIKEDDINFYSDHLAQALTTKGTVLPSFGNNARICLALAAPSMDIINCVRDDNSIAALRFGTGNPSWTEDRSFLFRDAWVDEADGTSLWASTLRAGLVRQNKGQFDAGWEDRSWGLPYDGGVGITALSQHRANPDVLYLGVEGRGIWRTDTGGR